MTRMVTRLKGSGTGSILCLFGKRTVCETFSVIFYLFVIFSRTSTAGPWSCCLIHAHVFRWSPFWFVELWRWYTKPDQISWVSVYTWINGKKNEHHLRLREASFLHNSLMMFYDKNCGTKRVRLASDLEQMLFASWKSVGFCRLVATTHPSSSKWLRKFVRPDSLQTMCCAVTAQNKTHNQGVAIKKN